MNTKKNINQQDKQNHYHLLSHQRRKLCSTISKYLLAGFLLILLILFIGCTNEPALVWKSDPLIIDNSQKLIELESRITTLEANQLTTADILTITNLKKIDEPDIKIPGCPSDSDIDKWFEEIGDGISQRQFDRILKKYNSEACQ